MRLETSVYAVSPGNQFHLVTHVVIEDNLITNAPWQKLQKLLLQPWTREDGRVMKIRKACLDTGGHFTSQAMAMAKQKSVQGILVPIKGSSTPIPGVIKQSKTRSRLWLIDTNAIKDSLYASIKVESPGPGYYSFYQEVSPEVLQQLMSQRKVKSKKTLQRAYETIPGQRDEVADCAVYARAALRFYAPKPGEIAHMAKWYSEQEKPEKEIIIPERTVTVAPYVQVDWPEEQPKEEASEAIHVVPVAPRLNQVPKRIIQRPIKPKARRSNPW
jgi:phage terminase large subunit GpA-like protein